MIFLCSTSVPHWLWPAHRKSLGRTLRWFAQPRTSHPPSCSQPVCIGIRRLMLQACIGTGRPKVQFPVTNERIGWLFLSNNLHTFESLKIIEDLYFFPGSVSWISWISWTATHAASGTFLAAWNLFKSSNLWIHETPWSGSEKSLVTFVSASPNEELQHQSCQSHLALREQLAASCKYLPIV